MTVNAKKIPALRFPEFEEEWEEKKLGLCATKIGSGSTPRGGESVYQKVGIPFIRSQNVNNDRLDLSRVTFISEQINAQMSGTIVHPLDLLLNITGASIGRSCVVPKSFECGNVNQHVCIVRLKKNYSPFFIQAKLSSFAGQKAIIRNQVGGSREGLNFQSVRLLKFDFPSFLEQQKITAFLTTIDTRIQQLSRKKALLEQYKKGVMQQIFSQEIRFKDEDGKEYPAWEKKKLADISKIYDGTHQTPNYVNKGVPFYSVEHITRDDFKNTKLISEEVFEKENQRVKLEKGDILMTRIGDIGTPKYISWEVRASFYVSLALIKQSTLFNARFLNQFIQSIFFQKELHKRTIHVAFPKKINLGEIGNCRVQLPSLPEQKKIAAFLTAIDRQINLVSQQLERMQTFKKGLLQQLFV